MSGRTFAIGDIHGCDVALEVLLSHISPDEDDTVVVLGDVVDRGPGTKDVIDQLLELQRSCRLIFIMGNHEEMMLDAVTGGSMEGGWLTYGGREAMMSYGMGYDAIPAEHLDFLRGGLGYWQTDTEIFIHANLEPGIDLEHQEGEWLRWARLTGFEYPHPSGKRVICGHTSQPTGMPYMVEGWVCLDTRVYDRGWLTCLEVGPDIMFQTNQEGAARGGISLRELH